MNEDQPQDPVEGEEPASTDSEPITDLAEDPIALPDAPAVSIIEIYRAGTFHEVVTPTGTMRVEEGFFVVKKTVTTVSDVIEAMPLEAFLEMYPDHDPSEISVLIDNSKSELTIEV